MPSKCAMGCTGALVFITELSEFLVSEIQKIEWVDLIVLVLVTLLSNPPVHRPLKSVWVELFLLS